MADIGKDIERPLGQTVRPRAASRRVSARAVATTLVVLAALGISGAIALREKPFRKPEQAAVSTPKVTAAAEPAAAAPTAAPAAPKAEAPPKAAGPQIIHMQTQEGDGPPNAAIVIHDLSLIHI